MRVKIKKGGTTLEIEDSADPRNNYCMNGHRDTIEKTISVVKQIIDEFIRLDSDEVEK